MSDATLIGRKRLAAGTATRRGRALPTIPDPGDSLESVIRAVRALKEGYEVLAGQRGLGGESATRLAELDKAIAEL